MASCPLRSLLRRRNVITRALGAAPTTTRMSFSGGEGAYDLAGLNAEMGSILGPLGDPDYDGDGPTSSTQAGGHAAPQAPAADMRFLFGGGASSSPGELSTARAAAAAPHRTDRIQEIVAQHEASLQEVMREVLSNHHTQLAAAIRTEMRLQDMRRAER